MTWKPKNRWHFGTSLTIGVILVLDNGRYTACHGDGTTTEHFDTADAAAAAVREAHLKRKIERDRRRIADHVKKFAAPADPGTANSRTQTRPFIRDK
jgi:hypothetical protein